MTKPLPFDPEQEAAFERMLEKLLAREDERNGPGAGEQMVKKGQLLMSKRAEELTEEEKTLLAAPPPAKQS